MNFINQDLKNNKSALLNYYRERKNESMEEIRRNIANSEFKKQASEINTQMIESRENLIKIIHQKSLNQNWSKLDVLKSILLATYTNYIVMIEARNDFWKYEYMSFSRRIGEMWEPFCKLCFYFSINE